MANKPKRILCIEDDPDTRGLLVEELEEAGFTVTAAADGLAGLEALKRDRPDLILCDIDLPDVSGLEVLQSIPELGQGMRAIPFVLLTAYGQRENQLAARRLGCDEYIVKPIDFELLVEVIRNRITRSRAPVRPDVQLTEREREALTWSARGKSSADMAVLMGVSERTANFHIDNAIRKLGVATRIQAAVKASLLGLVDGLGPDA
ncbi:response regulator transcription factor [Azospirillum picis]|uniref:DNA-binding NarL/FixJ family response regulator n=1 Tax=Azospirillum picis TaxID=488438 RepID=A0ABU0MTN6_9PROT|nr:response regulator transcription factor [Azospirillum picis]MBP2303059.1 DNA-binding NarL/FixJ family response regulator [Azospirillum picis]MDQ0536827.1 DNA-binding NarL/FixJ family response regulator [Azospirillum picis]